METLLLKKWAESSAKDGTSCSAPPQAGHEKYESVVTNCGSSRSGTTRNVTIELLNGCPVSKDLGWAFWVITVSNGTAMFSGSGLCDDGSDQIIIHRKLFERKTFQGIVQSTAICPIKLKVAAGSHQQSFTLAISLTSPRTILILVAESVTVVNVTYLIAKYKIVCEELLIGLLVHWQLQVDTWKILEQVLTPFTIPIVDKCDWLPTEKAAYHAWWLHTTTLCQRKSSN